MGSASPGMQQQEPRAGRTVRITCEHLPVPGFKPQKDQRAGFWRVIQRVGETGEVNE